ncbi:MAG: glycoside hydrolase family 15 protein [Chloroflexota bacterium]|nr:glycoside hydrolase family 15 protein [Chloroflexota bacterium]
MDEDVVRQEERDRRPAVEERVHEVAAPVPGVPAIGYRAISDYALIGDAQSAALVASDGTIDWLCLPHFDSPAVLCRILDAAKGGFLAIRPSKSTTRALRRYLPGSAVLETTLETDDGSLRVTDAMPLAVGDPGPVLDGIWGGKGRHRIVRLLEAVDTPLDVTLEAKIGFDFAATSPTVEIVPGQGAILSDGSRERFLVLVWSGTLVADADGTLTGSLQLDPGTVGACVLAYEEEVTRARALLEGEDWEGQVRDADASWRAWSVECQVEGPYRDALLRSALTLKLLTFEPTGALVAAPTTSLPESIGGERNWDYRYCWLRDATFTLYALLLVGDHTAAHAFWHWIERVCGSDEDAPERLQIMYGLHGERDLPERTLDHLSGYRDSRPVRVGNAAADQRQLDVYGELLDAFWFYRQHASANGEEPSLNPRVWHLMRSIADYICEIWREKDQGLWEQREAPQHFVHSKVMCWVGLDRAVRLARKTDLACNTTRWERERDTLREDILKHGYSETARAFTMYYGTDELDAATLRMPLVGFLPADDPRMRSTIEQVQAHLGINGLVTRYRANDGLVGQEGAFSICTFWLVDCLTALGRIDEAQALFERMLGYASDLGLFAEEVDPASGAALGNYPQAFTHLALIDAGVDLSEALQRHGPVAGPMHDRAETVRQGVLSRRERS